MKKIILPQLRQTYGYDCGPKALQTILAYYGIEIREDKIIKESKTTKEGTSIKNIVKIAKKYGLKTISKKMCIEDVKNFIGKKIPVIMVLQAWTEKKDVDWSKDWIDGHYVVAVGYTKDKVLFVDPSSFKKTYLTYKELEGRWHDMDTDKKRYFHHGIAIYGKRPKFRGENIIHMD